MKAKTLSQHYSGMELAQSEETEREVLALAETDCSPKDKNETKNATRQGQEEDHNCTDGSCKALNTTGDSDSQRQKNNNASSKDSGKFNATQKD